MFFCTFVVFQQTFKTYNNMNAQFWIKKLELTPHPEGGYYKRFYESQENHSCQDDRGVRPCMTSIWFLIPSGVKTKFHKIKSDEIWFFHSGNPICIECINIQNHKHLFFLSNNGSKTSSLSGVVKAGIWFSSESLPGKDDYSLVSCVVAPGFDFEDFELMDNNTIQANI